MESKQNIAVGIDLGTTYSCVGVWNNHKVEIIPNEMGNRTTPSIVSFTDTKIHVGESAKLQGIKNSLNTVFDAKRMIGKTMDEVNLKEDVKLWPFKVESKSAEVNTPMINVTYKQENKTYCPEQISAFIIKELIKNVETYLQCKVTKAVITVPANFNDSQRQATKTAGKIAGIEVLQLLNEPTAAAIAYGFNTSLRNEENVMVFDIGGGTADVTMLTLDNGIFEVIATNGDMHLGGEDFDNELVKYCIEKFKNDNKITLTDKKVIKRIKVACEKAKINLSISNDTTIDINCLFNGIDFNTVISRAKFEDLCKNQFDKCKQLINDLLEECRKKEEFNENELSKIILVGGSSKIPKIEKIIKEIFPNIEICKSINPDESIAYGAAVHAAKITGMSSDILEDIILLDVTPMSLGTDVKKDGKMYMDIIIPKSSPLPCKQTKAYYPIVDNQKTVKIGVYQGEYRELEKNTFLGEKSLTNLPPGKASDTKINVIFEIDVNSILNVTAYVENNQNEKVHLKIVNYDNNLSELEIERFQNDIEKESVGFDEETDISDITSCYRRLGTLERTIKHCDTESNKIKKTKDLCSELENHLYDLFNKRGISKISDYELYLNYLKKLINSYSIIYNYVETNENDKKILEEKIKEYSVILKDKSYKDIMLVFQIFNNDYPLIDRLNIYLMRIMFNIGLKIYDKKNDDPTAKTIFNEILFISNYNKFEYKIYTKIIEEDLAKEHNDIIESSEFYLQRIDVYMNINKANEILNEAINESENIDMDGVYAALDYYTSAHGLLVQQNSKPDLESEAICLSNIAKIQYRIIKSIRTDSIYQIANQSCTIAMNLNKNVDTIKWYKDAKSIVEEIREQKRNYEDKDDQEFEEQFKKESPEIFEELEKESKKDKISFIKFILNKYPYKGYEPIDDIDEHYKKKGRRFERILRAKYSPQGMKKETVEDKKKYCIFHNISVILNDIFGNLETKQ